MTKARINSIAFVELVYNLHEDCLTIPQLCNRTGLGEAAVRTYVKLLHKRRLIRIGEWRTSGIKCLRRAAAYEWNPEGRGDAKRTPLFTPAQRLERCRAKKKELLNKELQDESQRDGESSSNHPA